MDTDTDLDTLRALNAARQPAPALGYFRFPPTDADSVWLAAISNAGPGLIEEVATLRARVAAWRAYQVADLDYVPHPASIEDRCALEKRRDAAWAEVMRVDPGWQDEAEATIRDEEKKP